MKLEVQVCNGVWAENISKLFASTCCDCPFVIVKPKLNALSNYISQYKQEGPAWIGTAIAEFKVQSANGYTKGPIVSELRIQVLLQPQCILCTKRVLGGCVLGETLAPAA